MFSRPTDLTIKEAVTAESMPPDTATIYLVNGVWERADFKKEVIFSVSFFVSRNGRLSISAVKVVFFYVVADFGEDEAVDSQIFFNSASNDG